MPSSPGKVVSSEPAAAPYVEKPIQGHFISLEVLTRDHCDELWTEFGFAYNDFSLIQWLSILAVAPPISAEHLWNHLDTVRRKRGLVVYAIVGDPKYVNHGGARSGSRHALGTIGYLDIDVKHRSVESGIVIFGKNLRRTAAATEAHLLLLRNVFEPPIGLPYRRAAWKNNSLNTASRRAAERIGYHYEGTWRNHWILNGQTRDSDWLSVIEEDWPTVKLGLERWLGQSNFDDEGRQQRTLEECRSGVNSRQPS